MILLSVNNLTKMTNEKIIDDLAYHVNWKIKNLDEEMKKVVLQTYHYAKRRSKGKQRIVIKKIKLVV